MITDIFRRIILGKKDEFEFNGDIGIEVYPTEVSEELLTKLKSLGVNLLSLGVQTFDDDKLKFLGRRYTVKDIENALRKVYSYNIHQLSVYPLIVFPMTDMYKIIREKKLKRFWENSIKKAWIDEISL